jgi:hypothetical protein
VKVKSLAAIKFKKRHGLKFEMRRKNYLRFTLLSSLALALFTFPVNFYADSSRSPIATAVTSPATAALQPNIGVNGFFATDKAQRGRTVQAAVVMEIPRDFHVNGNRPLGKYAVPTTLKIEASGGIRVGPVTYPRASVKSFSFSQERLAVYEGRVVMRFNITIPSGFDQGVTQLRVRRNQHAHSSSRRKRPGQAHQRQHLRRKKRLERIGPSAHRFIEPMSQSLFLPITDMRRPTRP